MKCMTRWFLALLGMVLGIGSWGCSDLGNNRKPVAEYGAPHATYRLSGTVTSHADGAAIEGISVGFASFKASTAKDGTWTIEGSVTGFGGGGTLDVRDVDGVEHGAFVDAKVSINPNRVGPGDGHWFQGTFEQKDIKIVLDEAK